MLFKLASLLAVFGLIALNFYLGRHGAMRREKPTASERIKLDLIDFNESQGVSLKDGQDYLAQGARPDDIALAHSMGDGWVVRRLGSGQIKALERDNLALKLKFRDFTWPSVQLHFDDEGQIGKWQAILNELLDKNNATQKLEEEKPYGLA
ncbi:MAG: hypothetical protein PVF65_06600 [Sphingomonadales bacterium]|jgi:hypothetical protein